MRIGNGYDVHRFSDEINSGTGIRLGGVTIEHDRALLAHSDGDVLIHALCDALLGSLALGDIGRHFPDHDPRFHNVDSGDLLRNVYQLVQGKGWQLHNADITVVAQSPRLSPYIEAMREALAFILDCDCGCISIKATTTEGLGFTGRGEGIAVYAVVLVDLK